MKIRLRNGGFSTPNKMHSDTSMKLVNYLKQAACPALLALGVLGMLNMPLATASAATPESTKPTIILVHGALADSSSWDGVISKLQTDGFTVIAAPDPLRSLKSDSDYVSSIIKNVKGPVVLVGHSYGGSIITNAATGADNIKALVYVAAYAPEAGENAFDLTGKFPGSILPEALAPPIALPDGAHDLYLQQDKFRSVFGATGLEEHSLLVRLWQCRQGHSTSCTCLHGAAGGGKEYHCRERRIPRSHDLPFFNGS
jgi:pimeloyl-ACP methyl ester carboxylesterase